MVLEASTGIYIYIYIHEISCSLLNIEVIMYIYIYIWENNNKPPIWELFIQPIYGEIGDDLWHCFTNIIYMYTPSGNLT